MATPIDVGTLMAPVGTAATDAIAAGLPIGIPVVVALVAITLILRVLGKLGVRR